MTVAAQVAERFDLMVSGFDRTLNGARVDEKAFEFAGLRFETEAREAQGARCTVRLRIVQDKVVLVDKWCDSIHVTFREPDTFVFSWAIGAMSKTYGETHLVPGWRIGENWSHHPDDQV